MSRQRILDVDKLWEEWFKGSVMVGCDPYFIKKEEFVAQLSALLQTICLEVIGEDEKGYYNRRGKFPDKENAEQEIQNQLRSTQRQKLNSLLGGEDE